MAMKYRRQKQAVGDDWDDVTEHDVSRQDVADLKQEIEGSLDDEAERSRQLLIETKDLDTDSESDAQAESEDEEESEDDEESDEDEELLKELEKIKKEKEARLEKQKEDELARKAANSNPLVQFDQGVQKSWRSTTFRRTEKSQKKGEFVNDMLRSEFHKRFMDKYVK
ncbi:hypothetical protein OGAPHI_006998 [Ogataea philodendri]|uniref:Pre-mRNA-splicing factor CWC15 n=1 Tax=Ogataea philodendri TaxID=1378263 RepID=A0A9P8NVW7_9ASCO|nr:uncharacterized protein OGAPHI_006998 [Ogataea philodendri]KAH3660412.1 hypothetical protein OGAPHI_006998 [Ogataea philodendri]